jgi:hypothetical protein
MGLKIRVIAAPTPEPAVVSGADLERLAQQRGQQGGGAVVGVTIPFIRPDFDALTLEWLPDRSKFRVGARAVLTLHVRQAVLLAKELSPCARKVWTAHEMAHVRDNARTFARLESILRADTEFAELLDLLELWQPADQHAQTLGDLRQAIGAAFDRVTTAAARKRDKPSDYRAVEATVRRECHGKARPGSVPEARHGSVEPP